MNEHGLLKRFVDAQEPIYKNVLAELRAGKKQSHWMWFIFPQIHGLGYSETSKYYSIKNINEAEAYLNDPVLGSRMLECCNLLLELNNANPTEVFGQPDDLKLKSCMTLFALLKRSPVFEIVLLKFFNGEMDKTTLSILNQTKYNGDKN